MIRNTHPVILNTHPVILNSFQDLTASRQKMTLNIWKEILVPQEKERSEDKRVENDDLADKEPAP